MNKQAHLSKWHHLWNAKIRLPNAVILSVLFLTLLAAGQIAMYKFMHNTPAPVIVQSSDCPPSATVRYRMNNYQYTHPLLLGDRVDESKDLLPIKNEVALFITQKKQAGLIDDATVYLKNLNTADWVCVNPGLQFNPGSLIKVPIMMTYLRDSEKNPGLLNKKFSLDPSQKVPVQTFTGDRIIPGKSYTIKELLYYMIAKSDNYATSILNNNVNVDEFKRLFVDLGMPEPDVRNPSFFISASDYSKFMRMLYNATFINNEDADFALSLLAQSDFKDGIVNQLPPDIKVAHKFGEWGNPKDPYNHQLHESGIVYLGDNPYLITVMTKGSNVQQLPQVISDVSKLVYDRMSAKPVKG
jgi:beta-lactamase class A